MLSDFDKYRSWLVENNRIATQEFAYLDSLDIGTILCRHTDKTVYEIMQIIEDEYSNDYLSKYKNDEMLFSDISGREFADYINWRYGIPIYEETIYRFYIEGKK